MHVKSLMRIATKPQLCGIQADRNAKDAPFLRLNAINRECSESIVKRQKNKYTHLQSIDPRFLLLLLYYRPQLSNNGYDDIELINNMCSVP